MDVFYYLLITTAIIFISLVLFIVLITLHIVKKKKPNIFSLITLILCCLGMYLFIPTVYLYIGYARQNTNIIEKAIKLSINPYEKRIAYSFLSDIYNDNINLSNPKNGNLAIKYMEKALNGEYKKYKLETTKLSLLYSIKGDYKKTKELNELLGYKHSWSLRNIYIMNNQYDLAIETFEHDNSAENLLKADLYKKVGKEKEAKETYKKANEKYQNQLNSYKTESKRLEFIDKCQKYQSVQNYKNWLMQQYKEYKF